MPLETATHISGLVASNPASSDGLNQADDHMRLIKQVLLNDIGASMTNGALTAVDGTSSAPSIGFAADATTGFYRKGTGQTAVVGGLIGQGTVDIGFIGIYAAAAVPNGYLVCDGQAVSRTTYAALFAAIGTTWDTIGADVGMGLRSGVKGRPSDPSVAQVLDSQLRQVAVWRGTVHPDVFADILVALGYHYNEALLVPERNNHGLVTCVELRDQQYPNLYLDVTEGTIEPDKETLNIGVFTSEKTKPLMIDKLRAFDRNKEIEINDKQTLEEMLTFVVTSIST
jgi:hypothetical protein